MQWSPEALQRILMVLLTSCRLIVTQFAENSMGGGGGGGGGLAPLLENCPGPWQWTCKNGECIAQYDVCDGIIQCSDGSDEWNCQDVNKARQQQKQQPPKVTGTPTTTTTTEAPIVLSLTKAELFLYVLGFGILAGLLVFFIRRRALAKRRAFARNRRGPMSALNDDDSDEEVLISSLYS